MCCVIGYFESSVSSRQLPALSALLEQGRIRGMHAFGFAWLERGTIRREVFHDLKACRAALEKLESDEPLRVVIHCRYSTSGDYLDHANNQPIVAAGMVLAFNGVISMKTKPEFEAEFGVRCQADNDGEIFLRKLEQEQSAEQFLKLNPCSFAGVWIRDGRLFAARNDKRPLHRLAVGGAIFYASTADLFKRAGMSNSSELIQPMREYVEG